MVELVLVYRKTRIRVGVGDRVAGRDGEAFTVTGGRPPQHLGSTGRIWVKNSRGNTREFFPSVFDAEWAEASAE